jgi:hypothetical protein
MVERLDQKSARAAGRIEHGFAERGSVTATMSARRRAACRTRRNRPPHRASRGAWIRKARRACAIRRWSEMDAVDFVDDIAQQVAADHAVIDALETPWR